MDLQELRRGLSALQSLVETELQKVDEEADVRVKYGKMLVFTCKINNKEYINKFHHTTLQKQEDASKYIVNRIKRAL